MTRNITQRYFIVVLTSLACVVMLASLQPVQGRGQDTALQEQVRELKQKVEELSRKVDAQVGAYNSLRNDVGQRILAQDQRLNNQDQRLVVRDAAINGTLNGHQGQLTNHQTQLNNNQTQLIDHERRLRARGL